jgi:hypothetical protein
MKTDGLYLHVALWPGVLYVATSLCSNCLCKAQNYWVFGLCQLSAIPKR